MEILTELPQLQSYAAEIELAERYLKEKALNVVPLEILEAGCGQRWELDLGDAEFRLTGVDLDRAALDLRRNIYRDLDDTILGDLSTVHLDPAAFDAIYSSYVLEHVVDADRVLDNFARWLRPGGLLVIRFPDPQSVRGFLTRLSPHWVHVLYYKYVIRYPGAGRPGYPPYPTIYHPTVSRAGIARFCRTHGFTIREQWGDGQHLLLGAGMVRVLTRVLLSTVSALSFGQLTAQHSNLIYVLEKTG